MFRYKRINEGSGFNWRNKRHFDMKNARNGQLWNKGKCVYRQKWPKRLT